MQYGKEESGEELAVTKDVRFYYTYLIQGWRGGGRGGQGESCHQVMKCIILHFRTESFFIILENKHFILVLTSIMKGFHDSWVTEMANHRVMIMTNKPAYL